MRRADGIFANSRLLRGAGLLAVAGVAASSQAYAGLTDVSLFRSAEYVQTGPSTVAPFNSGTNYFFTGLADVANSSDYDVNGLTLVVPTSPSTFYTMSGPTGSSPFIEYFTQSGYLTKSDLDATYPAGDYFVDAVNSGTGASAEVTLTYDGTDLYADPPTLTAATYNGLAGLNPSDPYTFGLDPFNPTGGNFAQIFFTIYDATTFAPVFSESFLPDTTTSISVPGGTLAPGTEYFDELIFSTRDEITDPTCVGSDPGQCPGLGELGWDSRTETFFTTGAGTVPEPSTWAMMLIGFGGLGYAAFRRRAKARLIAS
jgi:PEP-CTERM motif-containing protein